MLAYANGLGDRKLVNHEKQADFLLSDDRGLRKAAKTILTHTAILHTGSILIFAKSEDLIDSVKDLLDKLLNEGIWMDDKVYNEILIQSGEL